MTPEQIKNGPAVMREALKDISRIGVSLCPDEMLAVIAHVQLALRHPRNTGPSAKVAEEVIRRWIGLLPDAVQPYMLLGFDPQYDTRYCRVCGCTDEKACMTPAGPCHWVDVDLCSACATDLDDLAGDFPAY
jgi:hypothetical protein